MNIALIALCAILMVFGVTELVRVFVFWRTKPLTAGRFTVLAEPKGAQDCEAVVRAAAERMRWLDLKGPCRLVCIDPGTDPEVERICRFLSLQYPYLKVSKKEDLVYNLEQDDWEREHSPE